MAGPSILVGDIGGTNARFAIADTATPGFSKEKTLRCADYDSADLAIEAYVRQVRVARPSVISLAVAGPIVGDSVRFTNNPWRIDVADLRAEFKTDAVCLLNDFEAIACSIPLLAASDCLPIGLPPPADLDKDNFTVGVIGPGTGLGAAGLCKRKGQIFPVVGQAGHEGFAPETQAQIDILTVLRERFDRVSAERLVSGPGLENIYRALTLMHGEKRAPLSAPEIFAKGADNSDPRAAEALQMLFEAFGQVAGNLALTFGAADGIFLAGGIARRYPEMLANSCFRSAFETKGRYRSLMEQIPTQLVMYPEPGLLGASYRALQM